MEFLEYPGHVASHGAHCLHAFQIAAYFAFFAAVGYVPVLRGYDGHVAHLEHRVHGLQCRCGASTAADADVCHGFVVERRAVAVEHALDKAEDGAIGLPVVYGRSEYEAVGFGGDGRDAVGDVVGEYAALLFWMVLTPLACDAAAYGLRADFYSFGSYPFLLQNSGRFRECSECVAAYTRACVYQ